MMEGPIRGVASFGHKDMDMRMEVDAITESLDYSPHTRHKPKACGCVEKRDKRFPRRETERIEEILKELERNPPKKYSRPPYPIR